MRYLAPFALLLCMTAVNAETINTNSTVASAVSADVLKTTQSVAQKLVTILELTTVSSSEQDSISLKQVVIRALGEGKSMSDIRLATTQAVKEMTGKTLPIVVGSNVSAESSSSTIAQSVATQNQAAVIAINPAEVVLDPETGKMMATVQPGESIFRLAQRVYGKENGRKFLEIFAANRDKIRDINVVVEGQVLAMP